MDTPLRPSANRLARLWAGLHQPYDIAALAVFRMLFGAMMAYSLIRFALQGWIKLVLVEPTFFFKYAVFPWTVVADPPILYLHFAITALAAICVSLGLFYRVAIVVFWFGFTYLQLLDVTLYLNHYYLVVLLGGIMIFLPLHRGWSLDVWRNPRSAQATLPAWMTYLLRFQIAVVYFYAALAKAQPDWLLYAQPLNIWMWARTETPIIGPLLDQLWVAYAMAWAGFLYDLTIWIFLLWRPTRPWAYAVVLCFHGMTAVFFEIGMFPIIMTFATTIFFDPNWPRAAWARVEAVRRRFGRAPAIGGRAPASNTAAASETAPINEAAPSAGRRSYRLTALSGAVLTAYVVFQALFPLRHYLYPGDVLWNEEGMRYAWKVMVREKNGSITYRVTRRRDGRTFEVSPLRYLTWRQFSDMSGQPDLIVQLGKHIAWDFERKGHGEVEVRVDALVSLNGRRAAPLIDPDVDISRVSTGWGPAPWILPMPSEPPLQLMKLSKK